MKALWLEIRTSLLATALLALLLCGVFPTAIWIVGQLFFREMAQGSLLVDEDGTVRGSALLAQRFTRAEYFHPRPSAAGTGYDAASSGGTNLGPTSRKLTADLAAAVAAYRTENNLASNVPLPADAVTSSASGLDPHISPANAALQTDRVARARHLSVECVHSLVAAHTTDRDLGIFGEPRINVLRLNIALDRLARPAQPPSFSSP